jgi:uncharacterized membrane protein YadS
MKQSPPFKFNEDWMAVFIGFMASNTMNLPDWLRQAVQSEFYIKIGLVLLGTTVLFTNIMKAGNTIKGYQNIWFSMAFVCIGLETRFRDIFKAENRRPMYAFLWAQLLNVIITFFIAYLLFR